MEYKKGRFGRTSQIKLSRDEANSARLNRKFPADTLAIAGLLVESENEANYYGSLLTAQEDSGCQNDLSGADSRSLAKNPPVFERVKEATGRESEYLCEKEIAENQAGIMAQAIDMVLDRELPLLINQSNT